MKRGTLKSEFFCILMHSFKPKEPQCFCLVLWLRIRIAVVCWSRFISNCFVAPDLFSLKNSTLLHSVLKASYACSRVFFSFINSTNTFARIKIVHDYRLTTLTLSASKQILFHVCLSVGTAKYDEALLSTIVAITAEENDII